MERKVETSDRRMFEKAATLLANGVKSQGRVRNIVKNYLTGKHSRPGVAELVAIRKFVDGATKETKPDGGIRSELRLKIERAKRLMETNPPKDARLRTFLQAYTSRSLGRIGPDTVRMVETYLAQGVKGAETKPVKGGAQIGMGMSGSVEMVAPEDAFAMLGANEDRGFSNRSLNKARISMYAEEMKAGRWKLTGESIVIGRNGEIMNGQHRLYAVIDSGVSVPLTIVRGVHEDAFYSMDQGMPRSAADVVGISMANKSVLAAILRLVWLRDRWGLQGIEANDKVRFTNEEAIATLNRHREEAQEATVWGKKVWRLCPPAAAGFSFFICAEKNRDVARAFFGALASGEGLFRGNPMLTLRQRLISDRSHAGVRQNRNAVIKMIVRVWNAHRAGENLTKMPGGIVEAPIQNPK